MRGVFSMKYIYLVLLCVPSFLYPMVSYTDQQKQLLQQRLIELQAELTFEQNNVNALNTQLLQFESKGYSGLALAQVKIPYSILVSASKSRQLHIQDEIFKIELILSNPKKGLKEIDPSHVKIESFACY